VDSPAPTSSSSSSCRLAPCSTGDGEPGDDRLAKEWEVLAGLLEVHLDAAEVGARWGRLPRAAQEVNAVTAHGQSREDFPKVKLGAASLRILVVLPVEYEYPH